MGVAPRKFNSTGNQIGFYAERAAFFSAPRMQASKRPANISMKNE